MRRTLATTAAALALTALAGTIDAAQTIVKTEDLGGGNTRYTYDNGETRIVTGDGYDILREASGWMRVKSPDGSNTSVSPEGIAYTRRPNGNMLVNNPDGSRYLVEPSGRRTYHAVDGTKTVVEPNGATTVTDPNGNVTGGSGPTILIGSPTNPGGSGSPAPKGPSTGPIAAPTSHPTGSPVGPGSLPSGGPSSGGGSEPSGSSAGSSDVPVLPYGLAGFNWKWHDERPAVGDANELGHDAKSIAQWNVVPHQMIDGTFDVGVVAFHIAGIERIEYSLNGGKAVKVAEPTLNPRTGVIEYTARIDASSFPDGEFEVRAIAYPVTGLPRTLEPLWLVNNHRGAYDAGTVYVSNDAAENGDGSRNSPYSSINFALGKVEDGGTIVLLNEGVYDAPMYKTRTTFEHWVTIEADAGLDRDQVIVRPSSRKNVRPYTAKLRWKGISFDFAYIMQYYPENSNLVWFDECRWFDSAGWGSDHGRLVQPVRTSEYIGGSYATNCIAEDVTYGFTDFSMVRNCEIRRISGDALQNSRLVLNARVDQIDGTVKAHHSDLLQYFGTHENVIVYGVQATNVVKTQNFFLDHYQTSFDNCAFVNIAVQNFSSNPPMSQMNSNQNHVLFLHVSNPDQTWSFRDDFAEPKKFVGNNVAFFNCVVETMYRGVWQWEGVPEGVIVRDTHFQDASRAVGENYTTGDVELIWEDNDHFEYRGYGAQYLPDNATAIPGIVYPELGDSIIDRGAFPQSLLGG